MSLLKNMFPFLCFQEVFYKFIPDKLPPHRLWYYQLCYFFVRYQEYVPFLCFQEVFYKFIPDKFPPHRLMYNQLCYFYVHIQEYVHFLCFQEVFYKFVPDKLSPHRLMYYQLCYFCLYSRTCFTPMFFRKHSTSPSQPNFIHIDWCIINYAISMYIFKDMCHSHVLQEIFYKFFPDKLPPYRLMYNQLCYFYVYIQ